MFNYNHSDFFPLSGCIEKKTASGRTISVVIPTYNEAATIGRIVGMAKKELLETALVDEIVVIDSNSTDATVSNALAAGAKVFHTGEVAGAIEKNISGKGAALWESLFYATGDIVVCIDADIINFSTKFIYGLIGPFLENNDIIFAKAYYDRPLKIGNNVLENYGGRVTEILVRPLLSAFTPELAKIFQPLSGEYAFLREPVENIPFSSGYGVEIGLIFDLYEKYGLNRFAQVDMGVRYHRNRPVSELGKMSFGILQTILRKLEKKNALTINVPFSNTMISRGELCLEETEIREIELPPKALVNRCAKR
ncbi:MAG TPA: glucosyl-3-phosphoglycerate synthase [Fibrobacteres bacterium]|jgi:glucosyl-3-phosphoglycerate synthase|nr:glucosyl-3-phosphoglycerate synthase [Fibrobacterota bacterium]